MASLNRSDCMLFTRRGRGAVTVKATKNFEGQTNVGINKAI